jgi:diketogulonate reductase-like aldo/keto reductase
MSKHLLDRRRFNALCATIGLSLPTVIAIIAAISGESALAQGAGAPTSQMEELFHVPDGPRCATNQVPFSLNNRGIERDLLPWCKQHDMPVMAYSPLGGDNNLVIGDPTLARIGAARRCSAAAVALAWVIRNGNVIAIPESGVPAHVKENAVALSLTLTPQDLQTLDAAYPGPSGAN